MRIAEEVVAEKAPDPELAMYRGRTVGLLKKYFRMSTELGHLPSVMGKEFFRSHVTGYGTHSFEDTVIFVHDVDRCLEQIDRRHQVLITRLFFQQYTNDEAAALMGCGRTTLERWRLEAVNALTAIFLKRKVLARMPEMIYEAMVEEEGDVELDELLTEAEAKLPPKKRVQGVKEIKAVAVLA